MQRSLSASKSRSRKRSEFSKLGSNNSRSSDRHASMQTATTCDTDTELIFSWKDVVCAFYTWNTPLTLIFNLSVALIVASFWRNCWRLLDEYFPHVPDSETVRWTLIIGPVLFCLLFLLQPLVVLSSKYFNTRLIIYSIDTLYTLLLAISSVMTWNGVWHVWDDVGSDVLTYWIGAFLPLCILIPLAAFGSILGPPACVMQSYTLQSPNHSVFEQISNRIMGRLIAITTLSDQNLRDIEMSKKKNSASNFDDLPRQSFLSAPTSTAHFSSRNSTTKGYIQQVMVASEGTERLPDNYFDTERLQDTYFDKLTGRTSTYEESQYDDSKYEESMRAPSMIPGLMQLSSMNEFMRLRMQSAVSETREPSAMSKRLTYTERMADFLGYANMESNDLEDEDRDIAQILSACKTSSAIRSACMEIITDSPHYTTPRKSSLYHRESETFAYAITPNAVTPASVAAEDSLMSSGKALESFWGNALNSSDSIYKILDRKSTVNNSTSAIGLQNVSEESVPQSSADQTSSGKNSPENARFSCAMSPENLLSSAMSPGKIIIPGNTERTKSSRGVRFRKGSDSQSVDMEEGEQDEMPQTFRILTSESDVAFDSPDLSGVALDLSGVALDSQTST